MTAAVFVGIDPGLSGAVARLHIEPDGREALNIHTTPVLWTKVGGGRRRVYDAAAMYGLLQAPATLVALERQQAMPAMLRGRTQGVASSFATGFGYGLWLGLLTARGLPHVVVPSQRWRKLTGLSKADKAAVRLAAVRRFPNVRITLDHADAVMLAVAAAREGVQGAAALTDAVVTFAREPSVTLGAPHA